jgi:3',5'-cyclic AMP phosphodiesterase CpdA
MAFSFIQITDHHLCESETQLRLGFSPAYAFRAVLRHIAEHVADRADFIISTGDLVEPSTDRAYQTLRHMLAVQDQVTAAPGPCAVSIEGLRRFPVYFLPGNHDDRTVFYRNLFPHTTPSPLMNAHFIHQDTQFICLDWGAEAKGVIYPETLDFLKRALGRDTPSIIVMHHHLAPIGRRWLDDFIAAEADRFWEAVTGQRVLGILCGHTHITYELTVEGIPVFGLRSTAFPFAEQDEFLICLQPPHYRLVTVQDGTLHTQIFEVPL